MNSKWEQFIVSEVSVSPSIIALLNVNNNPRSILQNTRTPPTNVAVTQLKEKKFLAAPQKSVGEGFKQRKEGLKVFEWWHQQQLLWL